MSIEEFVHAMPKAELHVHLEGAMHKDRLLLIAEQNEVASEIKDFEEWVGLLEEPDYSRLREIVAATCQWLKHPDDLAHVTYELGVALAKQNVRYAEVHVNPAHFTEDDWTFEDMIQALNDGRDRAERGWNVQMRWVLTIGRDQPRYADDMVRRAGLASGQATGIVGVDLDGPEGAQPLGQFERAFRTAARKDVIASVHAGDQLGAAGILDALNELAPNRLIDGWGTAESEEVAARLAGDNIPLIVCLAQALKEGWIDNYDAYPLRKLYGDGVPIVLSTAMPSFYGNSLSDEYQIAIEQCGLELEELEEVALNAVRASRLTGEEKAAMVTEFKQEYDRLRESHIAEETA